MMALIQIFWSLQMVFNDSYVFSLAMFAYSHLGGNPGVNANTDTNTDGIHECHLVSLDYDLVIMSVCQYLAFHYVILA